MNKHKRHKHHVHDLEETIMIPPSVGRIVWFQHSGAQVPSTFSPAPTLPAIVCFVHTDADINLTVFDSIGRPHPMQHVALIQDGEAIPEGKSYATWMPYQLAVAKREQEHDPAAPVAPVDAPAAG
jgi:hypothetical protein